MRAAYMKTKQAEEIRNREYLKSLIETQATFFFSFKVIDHNTQENIIHKTCAHFLPIIGNQTVLKPITIFYRIEISLTNRKW